jgi:hypothetical protein
VLAGTLMDALGGWYHWWKPSCLKVLKKGPLMVFQLVPRMLDLLTMFQLEPMMLRASEDAEPADNVPIGANDADGWLWK